VESPPVQFPAIVFSKQELPKVPEIVKQPKVCVRAANLKSSYNRWSTITSDKFILEAIQGFKIPFHAQPFKEVEKVERSNLSLPDI